MNRKEIKTTRINAEVQRELSAIIREEIKDPRIHEMTSVVSVEVTADLKYAKVHVSVLGDEEAKANTLKGLRSATPFIRGQLAKSINLRNTPELSFVMDQSIEYGIYMSKRIDEVNKGASEDENP